VFPRDFKLDEGGKKPLIASDFRAQPKRRYFATNPHRS
jgi:hypothetical protein